MSQLGYGMQCAASGFTSTMRNKYVHCSDSNLNLKRPPYPDVVGTAAFYFVHAGHRETAIDHAIQVIRNDSIRGVAAWAGDPIMTALEEPVGEWVVESLIQGAWLREYHEWEKATKGYFEGQHQRNESPKPDWKRKLPNAAASGSHVDQVRGQLALFGATVNGDVLDILDAQRRLINSAKHEDEYFVTEQTYRTLIKTIADFWNELASQEEFTVR